MSNPNPSLLDQTQIIQRVFDGASDRLRVDAAVSLDVGTLDVAINATDDSIRIYDSNAAAITLGQKTKAQSIPVVFPSDQTISTTIPANSTFGVLESGTVDTAFAEAFTVGNSILTTVTSYSAVQPTRLKMVEVSGTNIATYTVNVNGTPIHKKRTFFGNLDNNFQFSKGFAVDSGDVITIKVLHNQSDPGDFSAFILVLKD